MTRARRGLFAAALLLVCASCHTTIIQFSGEAIDPSDEAHETRKQVSMWLGLQEKSDPLTPACEQGTHYVKFQQDLIDGVLHFFIGGIYTTRKVQSYCLRSNPAATTTPATPAAKTTTPRTPAKK